MTKNVLLCFLMFFSVLAAHESFSLPDVTFFDGKTYELGGKSGKEINQIQFFPYEKYQIYEVPNLGCFYIDYLHDTIKRTLSKGHIWEPQIVALIKKHTRKGSIAIDLGSHIGTHLISMSKAVGEDGLVIGFEPQMKIFSELTQNIQLNQCHNVIAYRCAVGRDFGQVQMKIPYTSNEGGSSIGHGGDFAPLIPLDSLNLKNISLIKIDVECYEDEVLAGAEQTIRKNNPFIIIELADGNKQLEEKRDANIKTLENMGYTLTKLWGWDWIAVPNSDWLYIQDKNR